MVFWEYSSCDLLVLWRLCFTAKTVSVAPLFLWWFLSKVSLCIFHNANHYKNNQNDEKKWIGAISFNGDFLNLWWSFPMSWCNNNTDNEHRLICLWHYHLMAVKTLETSDSRILGIYHLSNKWFPSFSHHFS